MRELFLMLMLSTNWKISSVYHIHRREEEKYLDPNTTEFLICYDAFHTISEDIHHHHEEERNYRILCHTIDTVTKDSVAVTMGMNRRGTNILFDTNNVHQHILEDGVEDMKNDVTPFVVGEDIGVLVQKHGLEMRGKQKERYAEDL